MEFNKKTISKLAEKAKNGPQKKIAVDLNRVRREAFFLQNEYKKLAAKGPVSTFDFQNKWSTNPNTKYLFKRVNSLAKIISQGRFDKEKFEFMLTMGKMVERGRMREYDASVMVGQKFANEYVAPVVNQGKTKESSVKNVGSDGKSNDADKDSEN